jgi:hypothetical protein
MCCGWSIDIDIDIVVARGKSSRHQRGQNYTSSRMMSFILVVVCGLWLWRCGMQHAAFSLASCLPSSLDLAIAKHVCGVKKSGVVANLSPGFESIGTDSTNEQNFARRAGATADRAKFKM